MATTSGSQRNSFTYIVIGLGGLGSAAAYWLSRRAGADVLGLEQFGLGHERGESQDHSRIIRKTYHTVPYVRYAIEAYDAWAELEADAGEPVVIKTGELNFWPPSTTLVEEDYTRSMAACGVPFERLDNAELARRFPQFRFGDDVHAVYQPDGGLVGAMKANGLHRRLAQRNGATLLDNMPVTNVRRSGGGYEVVAGGRTFTARHLVVAAGPWTNGVLACLGLHLPLTVTQEQVTYFRSADLEAFRPDRFPVWIWMIADNYYGFPVYGAEAVKVAKDRFFVTDPDARSFEPDRGNEEEVRRFVARHIPQAAGPILYTKTCLLTHTPDVGFVIDQIPGHPDCVCAVGATHAFKFASVIGKTLSQLLMDRHTPYDIEPFRFNRPSLAGGSAFSPLSSLQQ